MTSTKSSMHSKSSTSENNQFMLCSLLINVFVSHRLQEDKMVFDLNLEIQFLLKQGQVEVDMSKFTPDFSDSVLVHRHCIEELNSQIKVCT